MAGRHRRAGEGGNSKKKRVKTAAEEGSDRRGSFEYEEGEEDAELAEALRDANIYIGRKRDRNVVSWR